MAKIFCCDNCNSIDLNKIGEEKRNQHRTEERKVMLQ